MSARNLSKEPEVFTELGIAKRFSLVMYIESCAVIVALLSVDCLLERQSLPS